MSIPTSHFEPAPPLANARAEAAVRIMEEVCDVCHWPYVYLSESEETLHAEKCDHCPVESAVLRELARGAGHG